ncbi:MAG TPA: DUF2182 domain-containing protein [Burkholderiales bacterium]|nr:DUF2182 domain-containing protein [Burkholderiales bacterium]
MSATEAFLRRERAVVGSGLAVLTLLAWSYVWMGAGSGMPALHMTQLTLFPHLHDDAMPGMQHAGFGWITAVAMWWVMMVAMMTPSAAPLVLLYARVLRHSGVEVSARAAYVPAAFLFAGYLAMWLVFSMLAAALQHALMPTPLMSSTMHWSTSAALSATLLAVAGLYQLSPLKYACLNRCRAPVEFLTRQWRPGRFGAFAMGVRHGLWCVGCCWTLMALLFVGGLMNLAWIALLTLLVLIEKLAPHGALVGKVTGVVLLAWAGATLLV